MKNKIIFLVLIVILGFILRFWQLGNIPLAMNWDEVAWGYNAYSLGIDGRDEFGQFLPYKYLESYGDYKPPIYAYLSVIPVKIFGLNDFSTRFASAFFGVLTILFSYFLVLRIFPISKQKTEYALWTAFFIAISPWHVNLSRAAFEANIATFWVLCGVWAFLAGMQEKKWYLLFSAIFFSLSFYTFNTPRIVVPILIVTFGIGFMSKIKDRLPQVILSLLFGLLMLLPLVGFLTSSQARLRFQEVNIFSDSALINTSNQEILNDGNAPLSKLLHNRRVIYAATYLKHYFDNLNPRFLFITGDKNYRFSTQDVGEMYFFDALLIVVGSLFLFRKKEGSWWIIPLWFLVGLIPASTARETPHALRILITLPTLQIICAYGMVVLFNFFKKSPYKKVYLGIISLIIAFQLIFYVYGYFKFYDSESAREWIYGYEKALSFARIHEKDYSEIHFTRQLGRPYMYYLYYNQVQPSYFRQNALIVRDAFGFVEVKRVGKYIFEPKQAKPNSLFIATSEEVPNTARILKKFYYPNGTINLVAYTL